MDYRMGSNIRLQGWGARGLFPSSRTLEDKILWLVLGASWPWPWPWHWKPLALALWQPTADVGLHFGLLNVRSLRDKLALICDCDIICNDQCDIFAAVETWHDVVTSPSLMLSCPPGFNVVERARPRTADDTLLTNHRGIALFSDRHSDVSAMNLAFYTVRKHCPSVWISLAAALIYW